MKPNAKDFFRLTTWPHPMLDWSYVIGLLTTATLLLTHPQRRMSVEFFYEWKLRKIYVIAANLDNNNNILGKLTHSHLIPN